MWFFLNVAFSVQAEVVEMSPAEAIAANLARLSYNASLRARAALRRAAARLSIGQVCPISLLHISCTIEML